MQSNIFHLYQINVWGVLTMKTTSVFKNGPSTQAVRIPKEYRLNTSQVWIKKIGNTLIIYPKPPNWDDFFDSSENISDDFSMDREQKPPQKMG